LLRDARPEACYFFCLELPDDGDSFPRAGLAGTPLSVFSPEHCPCRSSPSDFDWSIPRRAGTLFHTANCLHIPMPLAWPGRPSSLGFASMLSLSISAVVSQQRVPKLFSGKVVFPRARSKCVSPSAVDADNDSGETLRGQFRGYQEGFCSCWPWRRAGT
jgi:hypothetical protein